MMQSALSRLNEEERKEYWACLALRYASNIGKISIGKLMQHYNSAFKAIQHVEEWDTIGLRGKSAGIESEDWRKMAAVEWETARDLDAHIILWTSDLYPEILKVIPEAPQLLYAYGNLDLLKNPCMAVVGSRSCTPSAGKMAVYVAEALSLSGFTVVSGMARGIDRNAHLGGLKHSSCSIGVLGSGIDVAYPDINSDLYINMRKNGLLLSEFAPGTIPDPRNFPARNRIISGLSHGVVVIEASRKSGSGITAYTANEQNRNVFAVAGAVGAEQSYGCQQLIRHGAKAIFNVEDVLEDILPIIGEDPLKIDALLKEHLLSSENIFGHRSVLNPDAEEKKRRKKKLYTPRFPLPHEQESKDKKSVKSEVIQQNSLFKDSEYVEINVKTEKSIKSIKVEKNPKSKKSSAKAENSSTRDYKDWYSPDMIEYKILDFVFDERKHFDAICQHVDVNAQSLAVSLIQLELIDRIVRYEGSWFGRFE